MTARFRRFFALLAAVALVTASALPAVANSDTDARGRVNPAADVLFLRPAGFVSLVVGVSLFIAAAPIMLITRPHEMHKPFKVLVVNPGKYVWADKLGYH